MNKFKLLTRGEKTVWIILSALSFLFGIWQFLNMAIIWLFGTHEFPISPWDWILQYKLEALVGCLTGIFCMVFVPYGLLALIAHHSPNAKKSIDKDD